MRKIILAAGAYDTSGRARQGSGGYENAPPRAAVAVDERPVRSSPSESLPAPPKNDPAAANILCPERKSALVLWVPPPPPPQGRSPCSSR